MGKFINKQQQKQNQEGEQTVNFIGCDPEDDEETEDADEDEEVDIQQEAIDDQDDNDVQENEDTHEADDEYDGDYDDNIYEEEDDTQLEALREIEETIQNLEAMSINFIAEERKVAFQQEYFPEGYENSKYNVSKELEELKELIISKTKTKANKSKIIEKQLEETINLITQATNVKEVKKLEEEILNDEHQSKLMKKIQGVISEHQLVPINRHSENKSLY